MRAVRVLVQMLSHSELRQNFFNGELEREVKKKKNFGCEQLISTEKISNNIYIFKAVFFFYCFCCCCCCCCFFGVISMWE